MQNRTEEIEQFKSEINLAEYACAVYGFVYDPKSSSRRSAVVRHANGDKLVITKRQNNHHVYFNVSGSDSGTIIDFIQSRKSVSLGQIRKELRAWAVVDSGFPVNNKLIRLEAAQHDAIRVLKSWSQASVVQNGNEYLTGKRRIPSSTFMDPIFDEQIRVDYRRNLLFAHRNEENEITGFEIKNANFTGFSPGGVKSLFQSKPCGEEKIAVICETVIDLLSIATLVGVDEKLFFSTAGQVSESQLNTLLDILKKAPSIQTVWLAFDNDAAGMKLVNRFTGFLTERLDGVEIRPKLPIPTGYDWNDVLMQQCSDVEPPPPIA